MSGYDHDLPDAGERMCCYGAAEYGPGRCTCWVPEHDVEQASPQAGPQNVRDTMCNDCAFKPDSPERTGDQRYANSDEDGIDRVVAGQFLCHQGMRRKVAATHPAGVRIVIEEHAYDPGGGRCKADGSPADLCAGWHAARRRIEKEAHHG